MSEEQKQIRRSILFGYMCEFESFSDAISALNKFDFRGLHSNKKAEIKDSLKDIQGKIDSLLNKIDQL